MNESSEQTKKTNNRDGGLGAYLGASYNGFFEVRGIKTGSSCEKAGMHDGDQITELDGKSVKGLNTTELSKLIRGPVGSKLNLKILTGDGTQKDVVVERVDVSATAGTYHIAGNYEVLRRLAETLDQGRDASRQTEAAMEAGDFLGARALYLAALRTPVETHGPFEPSSGTMLSTVVNFFLSCGDFDQADQIFAELKRIGATDPTFGNWDPRNISAISESFERAGKMSDAEEVYKNLIESHPKVPAWREQEVLKQYCRFLLRRNRSSELPKLLEDLETLYGDKSSWQNDEFIADAEYATGAFSKSAYRYEKIASKYEERNHQLQRQDDRDRPLVKLLFKASDAYYSCKDYSNAQRVNVLAIEKHKAATPLDMELVFERQREFHPSMSQLLVQEGDIYRALGDFEKSDESYKKAMMSAKSALNTESPWCKLIADRLSAGKEFRASRSVTIAIGNKLTPSRWMPSPDVYYAVKSKASDRIPRATERLSEMQEQSGGKLNSYQIAQFFALIELERNNSLANALDLLSKLGTTLNSDQSMSRLILSVYEDWLRFNVQDGAANFSKTCSVLEQVTPEEVLKASAPPFEKLRWLALEWRCAQCPEIAKALLDKASELRNKDAAPSNPGYTIRSAHSEFDLRIKEDLCLTLIDLRKYSEAETLALDPAIVNPSYQTSYAKWYQICSAFEKAKQMNVVERILLAMATQSKQPNSHHHAQVLLRLSELYLETGQLSNAEEYSDKLAKSKQGHYSTKAYGVLAESLDKQNKLHEAFPAYINAAADDFTSRSKQSLEKKVGYLRRAVAIQEKLFGENDCTIVNTLTLLTNALQRAGKNSEVKEISERISQLQNLSFKTPEEELKFWQQMSSNYQASKEPDKALSAQRQVAKLAEKCSNHWGNEYDRLAQMELGQKHFKEAVAAAKMYVNSPYFLSNIRSMGGTTGLGAMHDPFTDGLVGDGHAADATEVLRFAENILRNKFGMYHRAVMRLSASIAKIEAKKKNYSGCEETCKEALDNLQRARLNEPIIDEFGSATPIESFIAVAATLSEQGRYEQSIALLHRILEIQSMFLGKRNPQIASTESAISNILVKQMKYSEAKDHAWNAIQIYETNHGNDWHALHHYVSQYLTILRTLGLTDEISLVKSKYKENLDPYELAYNSRRGSDLTFFRYDASKLEEGRRNLLKIARDEERLSGAYCGGTRAVIAKLIELETVAQNYEVALDLQNRRLHIISVIDSPEGMKARNQMAEIAELNQKLGRKEDSLRMIGQIVSILESIPDDAKSLEDKFNLVGDYISLGDKSKALALLAKLSEHCKDRVDDSGFLKKCANLYAKLGESKESQKLTEMANNIWKRQREAAEEQRQKRITD